MSRVSDTIRKAILQASRPELPLLFKRDGGSLEGSFCWGIQSSDGLLKSVQAKISSLVSFSQRWTTFFISALRLQKTRSGGCGMVVDATCVISWEML